jgi:hypothetical protein
LLSAQVKHSQAKSWGGESEKPREREKRSMILVDSESDMDDDGEVRWGRLLRRRT